MIDAINWTTEHSSVGTRVAGTFFTKNGVEVKGNVYCGIVTKFAYESEVGKRDFLYHIIWDDNDEEDYDFFELKDGINKYATYIIRKIKYDPNNIRTTTEA